MLWVIEASAGSLAANGYPRKLGECGDLASSNKIDQFADRSCANTGKLDNSEYKFTLSISALTGGGMDALTDSFSAYAKTYFAATELAVITRARHRRALEETVAALDRALAGIMPTARS